MSADTSAADAVARWRGYARHMPESNAKSLLLDACDLIDALAADLARVTAERDAAVAARRTTGEDAELIAFQDVAMMLANGRIRPVWAGWNTDAGWHAFLDSAVRAARKQATTPPAATDDRATAAAQGGGE